MHPAVSHAADVSCEERYGDAAPVLTLATGSPGELGLLKVLAEAFQKQNGGSLCWVKAGSGESLDMLKSGAVDMIMVHAPAVEKQAVADGWATDRTLIGSNEFFVVGPAADPAGIKNASSVTDAYKRISDKKALFFSRGDNSGTHKKEEAVWKKAGITPAGDWYVVTKDFMMATLRRADAEGGYFMTDFSTWVAAKKELKHLQVLYSGDPFIVNTYHALAKPGNERAKSFIAFVASPEGQKIIATFGAAEHGEALYNDAAYAAAYDK